MIGIMRPGGVLFQVLLTLQWLTFKTFEDYIFSRKIELQMFISWSSGLRKDRYKTRLDFEPRKPGREI